MLTDGLKVNGKNNVFIATSYDVCYTCELEEKNKVENREKTPDEIRQIVRSYSAGKLMKRFPTLRDRDGVPVLICQDCLKKFAEETAGV